MAQAIQQELATVFLRGMNDPRVAAITITKVEVTPDLKQAVVFYDTVREEDAKAATGLNSARGFLRSHLARVLNLRYAPELVFKRDLGVLHQARIEELLREDKERVEPAPE